MSEQSASCEYRMIEAMQRFGPDSAEAKEAAIAFCKSIGLDPHYKYPIWGKVSVGPLDPDAVGPKLVSSPPYVEEWQRAVNSARRALSIVPTGA